MRIAAQTGRQFSAARLVPFALLTFVFAPALVRADATNFTGTWEMDAAKSQVADGRTVTLVIETLAATYKIDRTVREKGGQETSTQFACGFGKECEFSEGSHKSKIMAWYDGPSLTVCKTGGPAADVSNEWKLELSPDKKTLTVTVSHLDPNGKDETLVFDKKP
jgi:hypothetical protein